LLDDGEAAMRGMNEVFKHELTRRKGQSLDDFLSVLAAAGEGEQA
jgi:hypothetical protein